MIKGYFKAVDKLNKKLFELSNENTFLKKQLKEKDLYIETLKYNLNKKENEKNNNWNMPDIFELGRSQ